MGCVAQRLGNGINWKSQIFSKMRNYTASNTMTGVGNALKRHYQVNTRNVLTADHDANPGLATRVAILDCQAPA